MVFLEFSHDLHHAGPAGFSFPQNGLQMLPKVERIVPPFTALSHHKPFIDFSFLVWYLDCHLYCPIFSSYLFPFKGLMVFLENIFVLWALFCPEKITFNASFIKDKWLLRQTRSLKCSKYFINKLWCCLFSIFDKEIMFFNLKYFTFFSTT